MIIYINKLLVYLNNKTTSFIAIFSIFLSIFIGLLDYITGSELSFSIFYLAPVFFASWFSGRSAGIFISIICALFWFFVEKSGNTTYFIYVAIYWKALVRFGFFIIFTLISTELKKTLSTSRTDFTTKTANKAGFYSFVNDEIIRARMFKQTITAVYIDLDNFKQINDSLGHKTGDRLLYSIAQIIRKNIRSVDLVARLGGDEFAIIFSQLGPKLSKSIIRHLRKELSLAMLRHNWPVTFSIGMATFRNPPDNADEIIGIVDKLMYSVKKSGKNNIKYEIY